MSYDLKNKLVVAISSRALFNLEKENEIFEKKGVDDYYKYQIDNENEILQKGIAFRLVENILKINKLFDDKERQVEVIILSRNNPSTSLRITKSIEYYKLDITRSGWTGGECVSKYLEAFSVDLFLSANESDVQEAINVGIASAKIINYKLKDTPNNANEVKIAFDGDAVLFSEESEIIYKEKGLEEFIKHEKENAKKPLPDGPFAKLLRTLSMIQNKFKGKKSPIRTALITARNSPAHERVIRTLNVWRVRIDEAFFLGGGEKREIVKAFGADIFFDDQDVHLNETSKESPSAKVPYKSN